MTILVNNNWFRVNVCVFVWTSVQVGFFFLLCVELKSSPLKSSSLHILVQPGPTVKTFFFFFIWKGIYLSTFSFIVILPDKFLSSDFLESSHWFRPLCLRMSPWLCRVLSSHRFSFDFFVSVAAWQSIGPSLADGSSLYSSPPRGILQTRFFLPLCLNNLLEIKCKNEATGPARRWIF